MSTEPKQRPQRPRFSTREPARFYLTSLLNSISNFFESIFGVKKHKGHGGENPEPYPSVSPGINSSDQPYQAQEEKSSVSSKPISYKNTGKLQPAPSIETPEEMKTPKIPSTLPPPIQDGEPHYPPHPIPDNTPPTGQATKKPNQERGQ